MKTSNRKRPRTAPLTCPNWTRLRHPCLTASLPSSPGDRMSMPWTNSLNVIARNPSRIELTGSGWSCDFHGSGHVADC
jgi:hypothetical protein